jgi:undecaprenyl-phosphate 4-deoxy-4-formamido-L-arabinose transferase
MVLNMKISFVIPCYGSEKTIEGVVAEIGSVMSLRTEFEYEIVCVNDSSPDNVYAVLQAMANSNARLIAADLSRNVGKDAAIMAGASLVSGDFVVHLDDDGQCPMDKFWDLYDKLQEGFDIVYARYPKKEQSAFKNFCSSINSVMAHILIGKPRDLQFTNFRIMHRFISEEIRRYSNPFPYMPGIVLRVTRRYGYVQMSERKRADGGRGNFTFTRGLRLWLNGFTAFSVRPLRISAIVGFLLALGGFVYGVYIFVRAALFELTVQGWSSTMIVMLMLGGVIMMELGMIGEYVGRTYISINNFPQYVIRKVVNKND